jgi:hypothetical protein
MTQGICDERAGADRRETSVGRGRGGKLVAWEGNHRIAAAAAKGRKIDVD